MSKVLPPTSGTLGVLSDLYPTAKGPTGGTFVRGRLAELSRRGLRVDARALRARRGGALGWCLRRAGRVDNALNADWLSDAPVTLGSLEYLLAWRGWLPRLAVRRAAKRLVADGAAEWDAIHAHGMYMVPSGSVAHRIWKKHGIPYVVTCHGSDINFLLKRRVREYRRVFAGARAVIFVSKALKDTAEARMGPIDHALVVPNGVDLEVFGGYSKRDARTILGLSGGSIIGYVGNLEHVKGADRLVAIFEKVAARVPDMQLVVVGGGSLEARLRGSLANRSVKFLGRLPSDQVAIVMAALDVLMLPSRNEGWPTVIMEAYASGTPVVGTDVGGMADAVGEEGCIVPPSPFDAAQFAEYVIAALAAPELPTSLRERASHFSWSSIVARELEALGLV